MKFMALLSLGAAAVSALQAPSTHQLTPRDLAGLTSLLQPVTSGLALLTDTTNSFPACGAAGLESGINVMIGTLTTATGAINYLKPFTMEEAQGFQNIATQMSAAGNAFFTAMESKIPLFSQEHICGDLVGLITNLGSHVRQLQDTVNSKFTTRAGISEIQHFADAFKSLVGKLQACGGGDVQPAASAPNPYLPPSTTPAPAAPGQGAGSGGVSPLSASGSQVAPASQPSATSLGGSQSNSTTSRPPVVATAGAEMDNVPSWVALVVALAAMMV